jgi:hypothetical protein
MSSCYIVMFKNWHDRDRDLTDSTNFLGVS